MNLIRKLLRDNKGVAAVEYGLLVALISLAAASAMAGVGNQLANTFEDVEAAMARKDR